MKYLSCYEDPVQNVYSLLYTDALQCCTQVQDFNDMPFQVTRLYYNQTQVLFTDPLESLVNKTMNKVTMNFLITAHLNSLWLGLMTRKDLRLTRT